jgi:hypothetical protein
VIVSALLLAALPVSAQKGKAPASKRCLLELERAVGREAAQLPQGIGNENYYFGGDVRFRCQGQNVRIGADSVESLNGDVVRFITRAYYRDADVSLRADTLTYYKQGERLEARGAVHVITASDSTTLDGPYLDYLRAVKGVRDSAESVAMQRPTLKVKPKRAATDTTADKGPYTIVADLLRGFGSSKLSGRGNVTIDRSDLAGRGDSLLYTTGAAGRTILTGTPASWRRTGVDSFTVTGKDIRLGLTNEVLEDLRAYGDGDVHQDSTRVSGDSVALRFKDGKLEQTDAWGRVTPAHATRAGYDIRGDSIVVKTPGEQLQSIFVRGRGSIENPVDTTIVLPTDSTADSTATPKRERDTLWGSRIDAQFGQVDSSGTILTRLLHVEARGTARSLMTQQVQKNGKTTPTINYSRADTIRVTMKPFPESGFDEVRMNGHVDGIQLETASLSKKAVLPAKRPTP